MPRLEHQSKSDLSPARVGSVRETLGSGTAAVVGQWGQNTARCSVLGAVQGGVVLHVEDVERFKIQAGFHLLGERELAANAGIQASDLIDVEAGYRQERNTIPAARPIQSGVGHGDARELCGTGDVHGG